VLSKTLFRTCFNQSTIAATSAGGPRTRHRSIEKEREREKTYASSEQAGQVCGSPLQTEEEEDAAAEEALSGKENCHTPAFVVFDMFRLPIRMGTAEADDRIVAVVAIAVVVVVAEATTPLLLPLLPGRGE
jgi:hypothetical protein